MKESRQKISELLDRDYSDYYKHLIRYDSIKNGYYSSYLNTKKIERQVLEPEIQSEAQVQGPSPEERLDLAQKQLDFQEGEYRKNHVSRCRGLTVIGILLISPEPVLAKIKGGCGCRGFGLVFHLQRICSFSKLNSYQRTGEFKSKKIRYKKFGPIALVEGSSDT